MYDLHHRGFPCFKKNDEKFVIYLSPTVKIMLKNWLILCISAASYSTTPSVKYFNDISCELKSDLIKVIKIEWVKIV